MNKARQSRDGSCKGPQAAPEDLWGMNDIQAQHKHPSLTGRRREEVCSSPACTECTGAPPPAVGIYEITQLGMWHW